jgi:hypothetical protein
MSKSARIINDAAVDVVTGDPAAIFHPAVAAEFVSVPDEVLVGSRLVNGAWTEPAAQPGPAPQQPEAARVSPVEFKLLFTVTERLAIKAARENDPVIDDFFSIIDDPRLTHVNLGLQSTQDALLYLKMQDLISDARRLTILAGQVQ